MPVQPLNTVRRFISGERRSDARPDVLQQRPAVGGVFPKLRDRLTQRVSRAAVGTGVDAPPRVQDGPTCGLYALGMVMDFWDTKDPRNLNPLVQDQDAVRWDSHTLKPDTELRLLEVARERGYTVQGEMFYADQLGALAEQFGYASRITENLTLEDIHAALGRGHPPLIAFDVDRDGNPGLFGGKRAHWAVIESHAQVDGVEYLVATHGWTGKSYVWRADDFLASVYQLNASDFPTAPKDITQTLKARMVEVFPRPPEDV